MSVMLLLAAAMVAAQCECGPGCACSMYGPCRCVSAIAESDGLPSIDDAVSIADRTRRPVVIWVGQRDADAEAALPEAIHGYASGVTCRSGRGVCYAAFSQRGERTWYWVPGPLRGVAALRDALGCGGGGFASPGSSAYYDGLSSGISAGGCGVGGCAGGRCGLGSGRFGRRR